MLIWEQEETNITPPEETLPPGGVTEKLLYWNPVTAKWEPISIGSGLIVIDGELVSIGNTDSSFAINLVYSTVDDQNGLFYYMGTDRLQKAWSNPVPSVVYGLMSSGIWTISPANTDWTVDKATNRANTVPAHTNDVPGAWIGFKLPQGHKIAINEYILKSRSDTNGYFAINWNLEVSNNVQLNTKESFESATWASIHDVLNESYTSINQSKRFTAAGFGANAFRWKSTGNNSGGTSGFAVGELEVYGVYTVGNKKPPFSSVSLLLPFDTNFSDASLNSLSLTSSGNVTITSNGKWNSCALFDNGYLELPASNKLDMGTNDWTIEGWFLSEIPTATKSIFCRGGISATGLYINNSGKIFCWLDGSGQILESTNSITANTFNHFAVIKRSGRMEIWLNGVLGLSYLSNSLFDFSGWRIGSSRFNQPFLGKIDDFRILNNFASFGILPTEAYPLT